MPREYWLRFWTKVDFGEHWIWTGSHNSDGYGHFRMPEGVRAAHRISYQEMVGPITPGLTIDHICRVRDCIRPDHLRPLTNEENVMIGEGACARHARQDRCVNGHTFVERVENGRPRRRCVPCHTEASRRHRARKAAA